MRGMVVRNAFWVLSFLCAGLTLAHAGDLEWFRWAKRKDVSFGGALSGMRTVRIIPAEADTAGRLVYGDRQGLLHVLEFREGRSREAWVSQSLKSSVAQVFVADVNADGHLEIVAYSHWGDIVIYNADTYELIWRSKDDEYATISTMAIANLDGDPQLELIFLGEAEDASGEQGSRLFVYDGKHLAEERRGEQTLIGESMVIANLDEDAQLEIAINTGVVIDGRSLDFEWHFGGCDRMGYMDVNYDGTPDLIGEFKSLRPERYIKVISITSDFRGNHGDDVSGRIADCASCHKLRAFCQDCHEREGVTGTVGHQDPGGRIDAEDFHLREAPYFAPYGNVQECTNCHKPELREVCLACHQRTVPDGEEAVRANNEIFSILSELEDR